VAGVRIESAGTDRLRVAGELSFETAASALETGARLIGAGRRWTFDLAGVSAGDSAGVAVLIEWLSLARSRDATLVYESVPAQMLAIARLSGVDGLLAGQPA
jgi:phospholipid transport system transporter-binding protein